MSQNIILTGTLVGNKIALSGSIPSAADIANAIKQTTPPIDLSKIVTKTDLAAAVADIEAKIAAIGTVTPPPPPSPGSGTRFPASGAEANLMPWQAPSFTPSAGATIIATSGPIAAGTFLGGVDIAPGAAVTGAGIGVTIIDISGQRPIARKSAVLTEGPNCTIGGMTVTGAAISYADGWNAGGICNGFVGWAMTLGPMEFYGCQEGIRSLGGNITAIQGGHVHHCGGDVSPGFSGGFTHGVYLNDASGNNGSDRSLVQFTGWLFEKALFAHEFKSRLYSYAMKNNTFVSTPIPGSSGSYHTNGETQLGGNGSCVDLPNGGDWQGTNNIYTKGRGSQDFNVISYGEEGIYPGYATTMHDESPTLNNQTGRDVFIQVGPGCTVIWNNPTINGYHDDPSAQGGGTFLMTGTITRNFDPA